jgi:hypothetical protein
MMINNSSLLCISVLRIAPSKKHKNGMMAAFLTRAVKLNAPFAAMPGWIHVKGDQLIPHDNSYQCAIPGTTLIIDAKGFDQSAGKAHFINDGLTNEPFCRIRQAPNGARYCLAYALRDGKKGDEVETSYERDYWLRTAQWEKLTDQDKVKAADVYNICAPDMLID